ncbi:MAG TPA: CDP-glycerol glycerophosphotransferase family protein [Stackebrandtia sp.]|uniref:bifunctional glycosyltransferase/CDP-glycerol:glycerophosphate glycerophosphotransferase n=1 Tax=Stackebrandtia sp. TaxID=2023065 RepID=UPI002D657B84|nr:CDP-glycerol glycerophosphotransferase family protein [Stackebrandtia sp.]HZE39722.1 CDP-glycerol glycerophosphotransferase family protein [Stackebrandtia sp.]
MLKISIIMPVFNVQGFIRECLDSILASSYPHLEVIGVNDCSPDQSGQILAEYAATDSRVRALRTPHNIGSGGARNLGLDSATGDYVWFVDSDDRVAPDAIDGIVAKLETYEADARPDVLVFDYQRLTETGDLLGSDLPGLLRDNEPPEAFNLSEWPAIARYTHTTWNRVVRRDFLVDLGLRFHAGWYQDVPWTYPLLLAAKHITLLNRPGYHYRQRRSGSVTRTSSDRHFEVLMQWERVWDTIEAPVDDPIRHAVFHRMLWHCMQVLGNDDRVMPVSRRSFFYRVANLFSTCLPGPSYVRPSGAEGTKHFLLQHRWYLGYLATRVLRRGYNRLRWGHPFGRSFRRGRLATFKSAMARVRGLFGAGGAAAPYYALQRRLSPKDKLVVFATEGYGRPSGACAAIDAQLAEMYPELRRVWLTTAPRPDDVSAKPGTAAALRALARAGHVITDFELDEFVVKRRDTTHVRVLSQTPIEAIGLDLLRLEGRGAEDVERLLARLDRWDFVVSPNRHASEIVDRAFQIRADTLEFGLPGRAIEPDDERRKRVREELGLAADARLLCHHPAARPPGMAAPEFDVVHVQRLLPGTTALAIGDGGVVRRADGDGVLVSQRLPATVDVADLYAAADIVVGDYRGALVDRAVAGLPVVLYLPDWAEFSATGRVTTDLTREGIGPVAHDRHLLDEHLRRMSERDYIFEVTDNLRHRFGDWRPGDPCDEVVRRVFGPSAKRPGPAPPTGPPSPPHRQTPPADVTSLTVHPARSPSDSDQSTAVN